MENRLGEDRLNNQGCLMKIIEYRQYKDIVVEFQDKYKGKVHTTYDNFMKGGVKNPYYPSVYGVGMVGTKYKTKVNGKNVKEYMAWQGMLKRCFDLKYKEKHQTYCDAVCCDEWLLFENFYEWLHEQENFDKWLNGINWAIDKDISVKWNKVYSPEICYLVPHNVNKLFTKRDALRGSLPIGVTKNTKGFRAECNNQLTNKRECLGTYSTPEQAFQAYKSYKENFIKQVAKIEFFNGNITEKCYDAMMRYIVEITD